MPFEVLCFDHFHEYTADIKISKLLFLFLIHRSTNMFTVVQDIDSDLAEILAYINDIVCDD